MVLPFNPIDPLRFINEVVTAKQKRKMQQEQQKKAAEAEKKELEQLQGLETYEIEDLYKKLRFGEGEDDLRKYDLGESLAYHLNPNSLYKQLSSQDPLVNHSSDENLMLLRQQRDDGFTKADQARLQEIQNQQDIQTKRALGTIERGAIERGANPYTTRIFSKIAAAQAAANSAKDKGLALDQTAALRQQKALGQLENTIQSRFNRDASVANAQDSIAQANTNWQNQTAQENWDRQNIITDKNVDIQNNLVGDNTSNLLRAQKATLDSENAKRKRLADFYSAKADKALGLSTNYGDSADETFQNAFNTGQQFFSGFTHTN